MFESEEDKKKKVYPRLPDKLGKKDTPCLENLERQTLLLNDLLIFISLFYYK